MLLRIVTWAAAGAAAASASKHPRPSVPATRAHVGRANLALVMVRVLLVE
jgi:hypothetical protein